MALPGKSLCGNVCLYLNLTLRVAEPWNPKKSFLETELSEKTLLAELSNPILATSFFYQSSLDHSGLLPAIDYIFRHEIKHCGSPLATRLPIFLSSDFPNNIFSGSGLCGVCSDDIATVDFQESKIFGSFESNSLVFPAPSATTDYLKFNQESSDTAELMRQLQSTECLTRDSHHFQPIEVEDMGTSISSPVTCDYILACLENQ